jgi:hypothetical protein
MSEMAVKLPLRERINFRIIAFIIIVGFIPLWVIYTYLSDVMHQGVVGREGEYTRVELKWMSTFDFDQVAGTLEDVPKRWREFDGKKVILRGEIWAPDSASPEISRFDLCYSIAKCCFSGPPQVQHFVKCQVKEGVVPYYNGQVEVRGTLHVKVIPGPEKVASVYQLEVERVDPVR